MTRLDDWARRAQADVADVAPTGPGRLDRANTQVADADQTMKGWQVDVHDALANVRTRLDDVDPVLARANQWLVRQGAGARIAQATGAPVDRSSFGKLVDDPELGDRVQDFTQSVADYTATLDQIKAVVGLRNEFVIRAKSLNAYLTMELSGRHDRFFVI